MQVEGGGFSGTNAREGAKVLLTIECLRHMFKIYANKFTRFESLIDIKVFGVGEFIFLG